MRGILIGLFLITGMSAFGCLNTRHVDVHGNVHHDMFGMRTIYGKFDVAYCQAYVDHYDLDNQEQYDYLEISDVGVHLAHLGEYEESLNLFRSLYAQHDTDYTVVSNLGTLYELNGMDDSAYFFIQRAIELNPYSHGGSEWVHLKVLEAKKALTSNPDWLLHNWVLGVDLAGMRSLDEFDIEDTLRHVAHQMVERVPFTPAPDLLLANIFVDLGELYSELMSVEDGYYCYKIADYFDPENQFGQREKWGDLQPVYDTIYPDRSFAEVFRISDFDEEGEIDEIGLTNEEISDKKAEEWQDFQEKQKCSCWKSISFIALGVIFLAFMFVANSNIRQPKS